MVSIAQPGRRHNEILPSALNGQNCVYTITCKQANVMALLRFNGAGSGNYSALLTRFTADWFTCHRKRISIWSDSFVHRGLAINKGVGKGVLK